ncbi:alkyl sulfatase dimerization domain-containing protein [Streptomyces sp. bgisy031]|uniref:alkyl sulfatase dimerization domain-containing protein n=1 Tax=Streptomyces sp. bgisy031 TaxID=3413772 RepID=UPI003D7205AB
MTKTQTNPYDVERTWPAYFLEHRKLTVDRQGTYRCGDLPVWTIYCPGGLLGNAIVIEGDDGLIVYDTGTSLEAGKIIAAEIRKLSAKPIRAIFYSHHHTDHYNGTAALVDAADVAAGRVDIYAWENFEAERHTEFGEIASRQAMGVAYFGGALLAPDDQHHHGIGTMPAGGASGFIPPTKLLSGDEPLTLCGVELRPFYTGGEALSEFGIHIPAYDMVLLADEFFTGIPNLHTIRGAKPRVPDHYVTALDRVRELAPEWLLGSHIMPLHGKERIAKAVTKYRDATQYLWDQSIRLINKGYTPVELQHALKELPEEVIDPPYTVPMYGVPFTSVPEFFTGWVSWFSGDATDMFPSPPDVKARRLVELMGGVETVLEAAKTDHANGQHQLAAELSQLALRSAPSHDDARLLKAAALRAIGYQQVNPIARSWYLTGALELERAFDPQVALDAVGRIIAARQSGPEVVAGWRYRLDADKAAGKTLTLGIRFTDTDAERTIRVRHRILVVEDGLADDREALVEATSDVIASAATVEGDTKAWPALVNLLDLSTASFHMHMR